MIGRALSLLLFGVLFPKAFAVSNPFEAIPREAWSKAFAQFDEKKFSKRFRGNDGAKRMLQMFMPEPATNQCDEVVTITPKEDVTVAATALAEALFPPGTELASFLPLVINILTTSVRYDIYAQVICSSCTEIAQLNPGASFLTNNNPNGFMTYCMDTIYGSNITQSGMLLLPYDIATGQFIDGRLRIYLGNHPTSFSQQEVPSQYYPSDLAAELEGLDTIAVQQKILELYWVWSGMMAATSGAAAIGPDYLGLGVSYQQNRSYITKYQYQQADAVLYLKALSQVPMISNGCVVLDPEVTLGGYSEGGYASFVGATALAELGATILSVQAGGSPFNLNLNLGFGIEKLLSGNASVETLLIAPLIGFGYSSTNPDLPNTGQGQNMLSDAWTVPNNQIMNIYEWFTNSLSAAQLLGLIPLADPTSMINQQFVTQATSASAQGMDVCDTSVDGQTNLLCQAVLENTIIDEVQNTNLPVFVCHSMDDEVISFGNVPDLDANPNLQPLNLMGVMATGSHTFASFFCLFGNILPYTGFNTGLPTNTILPLSDPAACMVPPSTSPTQTPVPSRAPVTLAPSPPPSTGTPSVSQDPTASPTVPPPTKTPSAFPTANPTTGAPSVTPSVSVEPSVSPSAMPSLTKSAATTTVCSSILTTVIAILGMAAL